VVHKATTQRDRRAAEVTALHLPTGLAKIMTGYLVLRDHRLPAGGSGPAITVTAADAAAFAGDQRQGRSVVKVVCGEKLTGLQALRAMLILPGNNIAPLLARWDAGLQAAFAAKMNAAADPARLGSTRSADASGADPATAAGPCPGRAWAASGPGRSCTCAPAATGTCLRLELRGSRVPQATLHAVPRGAWRGCCIGLGIDGRLRLGEMEARRQMRWHQVSRGSPAGQRVEPGTARRGPAMAG
jgi:hypothetical protein